MPETHDTPTYNYTGGFDIDPASEQNRWHTAGHVLVRQQAGDLKVDLHLQASRASIFQSLTVEEARELAGALNRAAEFAEHECDAVRTAGDCWNCGGSGVGCCEMAADPARAA